MTCIWNRKRVLYFSINVHVFSARNIYFCGIIHRANCIRVFRNISAFYNDTDRTTFRIIQHRKNIPLIPPYIRTMRPIKRIYNKMSDTGHALNNKRSCPLLYEFVIEFRRARRRGGRTSSVQEETKRGRVFPSKVRFIRHFAAPSWHLSGRVYRISERGQV